MYTKRHSIRFNLAKLNSARLCSIFRSFVHQSNNNKLLYRLEETKCTIYRNKKIWMYTTNGNVMVMKSLNHCYYAANEINFHHIATKHCNIESTLQIIWLGCVHGNIDETKTERARWRESFNCNLNLERDRNHSKQMHQYSSGSSSINCAMKIVFFFSSIFKHQQRILLVPMAQREKEWCELNVEGQNKHNGKKRKTILNLCSVVDEKAHVQRHTHTHSHMSM